MGRPVLWLSLLFVLLLALQLDIVEGKRKKGRPSASSLSSILPSAGRRGSLSRQGSSGASQGTGSRPRHRRASCPALNYTCPANFSTPPLILIALDGFRADYLSRGLTPTLERLGSECGLRAEHMRPVFPTTTYPNLYSIVTGLFPESHGIIDNDLYDPGLGQRLDKDTNWNNPVWWQKDPIWVSAERQGKKAATFFWLGSDVAIHGVRPTHFRVYNPSNSSWVHRVQTVLDWLDMPTSVRPSFITMYFNQPDNDGHRYGPDSEQVNNTIRSLDQTIASLINGLNSRRILGCVNVMIVSDHGMVGKSCSRIIPLDRYLDLNSVYYVTGAASRVRPKGRYNSSTIDALVNSLRCQTDKLLVAKKEELPKRFHFSASPRIEPVVLGPTPGWMVRRDSQVGATDRACTGGTHGYDNMGDEMKALFVAFGPAFKRNLTVPPFSNIELYELMTNLIGVTPEPNNGTRGSLHHLLTNPPALSNSTENVECSAMPTNPASSTTSTSCLCQERGFTSSSGQQNSSDHLIWGSPGCASTHLSNQHSVVGHTAGQALPSWAAFTLFPSSANHTSTNSTCWTRDTRLPTAGKCYANHINLTSLTPPESGSRLLSSASPMYPGFASGAYGHLVRSAKQWAAAGPVNVITGPAFDVQGIGTLVTSASSPNLDLPSHYFMVLTRCSRQGVVQQHLSTCPTSDLSTLAFLLPHKESRENCLAPRPYLLYHACRIRDVEYLTGLRFFKTVEPQEAARLRTSLPEKLWT